MDGSLKLILIAVGLLVLGAVLPWMMILELLESTLFLNFLTIASSTGGLLAGFIGIAKYAATRTRR